MSYLILVDKRGNAVLHRACTDLIPELGLLRNEELLFVVLATDYFSPYAKFPEEERIRKAHYHVYGDRQVDPMEKKHIKKAMEQYMSLQYDHRRELLDSYMNKVTMLSQGMRDLTSAKDISDSIKSIDMLHESIKKMQADINDDNDLITIEGGKSLSFIEIMQKNMKSFNNLKAPKNPWTPGKNK